MFSKVFRLRNLTPLEVSAIKVIFILGIFSIGACLTIGGQNQRIRELESQVESLKDEVVNTEVIYNTK